MQVFNTSGDTFGKNVLGASMGKLVIARHMIFIVIMIVIMVSAGSATVFWRGAAETKTAVGEVKSVNGSSEIVVARYNKDDLVVRVPTAATVQKDKADSRVSSLEVGDTVRLTYIVRPIGPLEAKVIRATSPFIQGHIAQIDLEAKTIAIEGELSRVFVVRDQTVILKNGSLAHLYDLEVGMTAKAEYRNVLDPQLDLLLTEE